MSELKWTRLKEGEVLPEGAYLYGGGDDEPVPFTVEVTAAMSARDFDPGEWYAGPIEVDDPDPEPIQVVGCKVPECRPFRGTEVWCCWSTRGDGYRAVSVASESKQQAIRAHNAAAKVLNENGGAE